MKEIFRYLFVAILFAISTACGKTGDGDEPSSNYDLNREDIIGEWYIKQAKFDKAATMTDWDLESTTFTFKENGYFEATGHFGSGTGSFSINGSKISTIVNNQPYIDFVINGIKDEIVDVVATIQSSKQKVWMTWYQPKYQPGGNPDWGTPSDVKMAIIGAYHYLTPFIANKQAIEDELIARHYEILSPSGSEIINCWSAAYQSLFYINEALERIRSCGYSYDYSGHIAHLRALRGFIAYNLATLWGKARFETTPHTAGVQPPILTATELLQVADNDLLNALFENYSLIDVDRQKYLNPDACQLLEAEVSLALGNKDSAKDIFERYAKTDSPDLYFEFIESDNSGQVVKTHPIYTKLHAERLAKEAANQLGGLIESWVQAKLTYGFWQMLKRIGKAEDVTGCQKYQVMFPYPWNEVSEEFPQNEGY